MSLADLAPPHDMPFRRLIALPGRTPHIYTPMPTPGAHLHNAAFEHQRLHCCCDFGRIEACPALCLPVRLNQRLDRRQRYALAGTAALAAAGAALATVAGRRPVRQRR